MRLFPISHCYVKEPENRDALQSKAGRDQVTDLRAGSAVALRLGLTAGIAHQLSTICTGFGRYLSGRIWPFLSTVTFKVFSSLK